ncbi:MAG: aminoacyl-tRNA hydrolase [Oscillospiraceae bacterium]|nr:aminoacyl-tRNA hydrolase [Oscillospiraceae bacterium]
MLFSNSGGVNWLVVGLGNPGPRYEGTRHNVGFLTLDALARALSVRVDRLRFRALTGRASVGGQDVLLMKPQTYMNLSGEAVSQAARFYKLPPERVIVVSDEVSLPLGKLRVRPKGSAGGHNGLKSVIACLGSDQFPRVRLGVGSPPVPDYDLADWVLSVLRNRDAEEIAEAAERAAQAVLCIIEEGPERAMNRFN